MILVNKKGYDPVDDEAETGYRRPPKDPACVADYFAALGYVEDEGEFLVNEMRRFMEDPEAFYLKE